MAGPAAATHPPACDPADQLPCACETAGVERINDAVWPCFVGDLNRQTETQTDPFAVKVFAAVSWPLGPANGQPDYAATPVGDHATVLDSWKSTRDIFRRDGEPPAPWESRERALPRACRELDVAAEMAKVPGGEQVPAVLSPRLLDEYVNPEGHALTDASGQPVRFEVMMNRQAFDYVVDNQLWHPAALDAFLVAHGELSLPKGQWNRQSQGGVRGAIVAKAAWKILDPAADDFDEFHKSWAYVTPVIRDGAVLHGCELRPVGLVGLHLALKLTLFPKWLWTTFEHRAVAPLWSEVGRSALPPEQSGLPKWLFYTPGEGARLNAPSKDVASGTPSRILRFYPAGYYYAPVTTSGPPDCSYAMDFVCLNQRLAKGLDHSVMKNYMLIGTQWVTPDNQGARITPEILGNATLESFSQATSSCVGCHSYAKAANTSAKPGKLDFVFSFGRDVLSRDAPRQATDAEGN